MSEFRRGWRVVLAAGLGIGCGISPVPFNVVPHLVIPLERAYGWTRGEIYMAVTLLGLSVTLMSPIFGWAVDRIGVRRVALGATAGFAAGWALVGASPGRLWAFYAAWVLMAVLGGASIPVGWTRGVAAWFDRQRGLALSLALASTGVTAAAVNLAVPALLAAGGWRLAVWGTALLPLALALPVAALWFRPPPVPPSSPAGAQAEGVTLPQALRDPRFWRMFAALGATAVGFGGIFSNFVPLLIGGGFTPQRAGAYAATLGLTIVAGRVLVGWLLDRVWAPLVALPINLVAAAAMLMLAYGPLTTAEAGFAALALGLCAGAETDLIPFLAARFYGLGHYGRIYGTLYMAFGVGSAVAPPLVGLLFDETGDYRAALAMAAGLFVTGAGLLLTIGPYPRSGASPRSV